MRSIWKTLSVRCLGTRCLNINIQHFVIIVNGGEKGVQNIDDHCNNEDYVGNYGSNQVTGMKQYQNIRHRSCFYFILRYYLFLVLIL